MNVKELEVAVGAPIRPAWQRLRAWVRSLPEVPVTSGNVRVHRSPGQTSVVAETQPALFKGAFAVRIRAQQATMGDGLLNGMVPTINGTPMDGVDASGTQGPRPVLDLSSGPNARLRSWIALQVRVTDAGEIDPNDPTAVQIIHTNDLTATKDGLHALAMLVWTDPSAINRVRQIVYFNQQHAYRPKTASRPAQHLFWSAA